MANCKEYPNVTLLVVYSRFTFLEGVTERERWRDFDLDFDFRAGDVNLEKRANFANDNEDGKGTVRIRYRTSKGTSTYGE